MTGQTPGAPVPTAPVAALPGQAPATDLASLQSQLGELRIQLNGLQAQWDGLHSQLDAMLRNNPARPGVQQQWADVGVQIAQIKGDIARLEGRIAQKQGLPVGTTTTPPPGPLSRRIDLNNAIPVMAVLIMVLAGPGSIAWGGGRFPGKPQSAALSPPHTTPLWRCRNAIQG